MDIISNLEKMDRLAFEITKKLSARIREGIDPNINHSHIFILKLIRNEGSCIVSEIAHHMGITLSAVTSIADKLLELGYVTRERSEKDRRIVLIGLTDKGNDLLRQVDENKGKVFQEYFSSLPEEEVITFFKVIDEITKNILDEKKS